MEDEILVTALIGDDDRGGSGVPIGGGMPPGVAEPKDDVRAGALMTGGSGCGFGRWAESVSGGTTSHRSSSDCRGCGGIGGVGCAGGGIDCCCWTGCGCRWVP